MIITLSAALPQKQRQYVRSTKRLVGIFTKQLMFIDNLNLQTQRPVRLGSNLNYSSVYTSKRPHTHTHTHTPGSVNLFGRKIKLPFCFCPARLIAWSLCPTIIQRDHQSVHHCMSNTNTVCRHILSSE